jgi:hypothetical protein
MHKRTKNCNKKSESASRSIFASVVLLLLSVSAACTRTVLVTEDAPIRTGPAVRARVYTLDADGKWMLGDNEVAIPEGWYVVPPSYVKE